MSHLKMDKCFWANHGYVLSEENLFCICCWKSNISNCPIQTLLNFSFYSLFGRKLDSLMFRNRFVWFELQFFFSKNHLYQGKLDLDQSQKPIFFLDLVLDLEKVWANHSNGGGGFPCPVSSLEMRPLFGPSQKF